MIDITVSPAMLLPVLRKKEREEESTSGSRRRKPIDCHTYMFFSAKDIRSCSCMTREYELLCSVKSHHDIYIRYKTHLM